MRSDSQDRENARATGPADSSRRAARWVWWGLMAGFTAVMALAIVWAVRSGHYGKGVNRGPAEEIAPGNEPARDIDRSRQP